MKSKKWLLIIGSILFVLFSGWYFLIKESDYDITFKVKTATGTVFQGINEWTSLRTKSDGENYTIVKKTNFDFIQHKMQKNDFTLEYTWNMELVNDSITKVSVGIKDLNHGFYNRLTVPFFSTKFKKEQIDKIKNLKEGIEKHIKNFKVKIDGVNQSEQTFVAYISLKSILQEKAQMMIANDAIVTNYLHKNQIKIIGTPYLEIEHWDLDNETLDFNYCFPIAKSTQYVPDEQVKFKIIPALKGLKATYYGNFRTSDRAWFALLDFAKKNNYNLENKPLEHFLANPFYGGDELEWKTEIIIPFSKNN